MSKGVALVTLILVVIIRLPVCSITLFSPTTKLKVTVIVFAVYVYLYVPPQRLRYSTRHSPNLISKERRSGLIDGRFLVFINK